MRDRYDVLVVGGGTGGLAAALAAAQGGASVLLVSEQEWLGGQLTSQGVPSDEHGWTERLGVTPTYRRFRAALRDWYRTHRQLTPAARADPLLNPGQGAVSPICAEPVVIAEVLDDLAAGLEVLRGPRPVHADVTGDRVEAVTFARPDGTLVTIGAGYVLDATEEGDLLPLTGTEHVLGAESQDDTGEPHALEGPADEGTQQAITWCVALENREGEDHTIERPAGYDRWRAFAPPGWPDRLLSLTVPHPWTLEPRRWELPDLWRFRRIRYGAHYEPARTDVTLVNWPQNDYLGGVVTGVDTPARQTRLAEARELTLSLVYWLQTELGRRGLRPCGSVMGTRDGLARAPYVREGRRIVSRRRITELDVGVEARAGLAGAERFADSVGVGAYRIDLHPTASGRNYVDVSTYPFQIPLGALLPVRMRNLLPAAKNIGTTHITNGCYRVHPVEWSIGEAAGALAAFCVRRGTEPQAVAGEPGLLADFQALLREGRGMALAWPADHLARRV
ncbi:FAD-dependent oxidoreductase [Nonomuraea sp. NPDC050547]|uniref:FAD-dependent oxidoreductase n=1 Tax=unclassified Nonomuraea TaxID=2593643 RepID=UPI0037902683